jgi:hypothetical protein
MHSFINNKIISTIIQPSLWVLNRIVGGKNGNADSAKIIKESKVPALLIWGEKDAFVTEKISTAKQADGGNIRKYILSEKRHNPYNTVSAEDKLAELLEGMNKEFADENARKAYFSQFNFVAATEEDPYVMQATVDFIEKR